MKNYYTYLLFITALGVVSCAYLNESSTLRNEKPTDSITLWIAQSKEANSHDKMELLKRAYHETSILLDSSLKAKYLTDLSYHYYGTADTALFKKINTEAIQFNKAIKDSTGLANAYWDLGDHFSEVLYKKDSGYYYYAKGQQLYEELGNNFFSARLLINMAIDQNDLKDYIGSETNTIKAIRLLEPLKKYKQLYSCYNNLAIIHKALKNYENALEYRDQAAFYLKKTSEKDRLQTGNLMNIGLIHEHQGNYEEAIQYYKKAQINNDTYTKSQKLKADLIDNIAYCKFKLRDHTELPALFYEALKIRDSFNYVPGIVRSKLHLTEYYAAHVKDTVKALQYGDEARKLAVSSKNFEDLLPLLILLADLEDYEKSKTYLNTYIHIRDSLQYAEFTVKNNFERLRYEAETLIAQNKEMNRKISYIIWGTVGFLALIILILLFKLLHVKYKYRYG